MTSIAILLAITRVAAAWLMWEWVTAPMVDGNGEWIES